MVNSGIYPGAEIVDVGCCRQHASGDHDTQGVDALLARIGRVTWSAQIHRDPIYFVKLLNQSVGWRFTKRSSWAISASGS